MNPENYVWSFVCLYLHGSSAVRLLFDEGTVEMGDDGDQEALWRFLYRRCGISRLLFKAYVAPKFELVNMNEGDRLDTEAYFFIVLDGLIDTKQTAGGVERRFLLFSGASFGIKHLRHLYWGCSSQAEQRYPSGVTTVTQEELEASVYSPAARVFRCRASDLVDLSNLPVARMAAQGLLISTLADIAERKWIDTPSAEKLEDEEGQEFKSTRSLVFASLDPCELPPPYLAGAGGFKELSFNFRHILFTLKAFFLLPAPLMKWRPGFRQVGVLLLSDF
ncbi:hypothetical protein THAOC_28911 [Thalassiosira oceanica]|uniref:Cyclic nucleotide-binding domain-containing protein n=1 Tax=Thalassiosira oceanica TaxID=159749 RepID=K0RF58_THAOC|nr:hypothetical protein THAOC_28911 [Thalassiosira oceanica]|eukprot:EJK51875.1 hypothetical protein THAOC_28911 [Thalassiosira oceanica]